MKPLFNPHRAACRLRAKLWGRKQTIRRLMAENRRLREALEGLYVIADRPRITQSEWLRVRLAKARAALAEGEAE